MASFSTSTQNPASSVFEMGQARTLRVCQPIPLMVCRQTTARQHIHSMCERGTGWARRREGHAAGRGKSCDASRPCSCWVFDRSA
ncbi:MAG: hypothetical protein ACJA0F_002503 [Dinoroseobacter sp.]|jgi:hypothetical protein